MQETIKTNATRIQAQLMRMQQGVRAEIIFTYPERHNIIDLEGWQALPPLMAQLAALDDIRLITCRGAGDKAFVAGADISQFDTAFAGATAATYEQATIDAFDALAQCRVPTLAAITGYCIGGGLALALCCDLRLARADSQFAIPAARLGLAYPPNATRRLCEIAGVANAKQILFTASQFDCNAAIRMGLLTTSVASADFERTLADLTTRICANAPLTLQTAKFIIDNPPPNTDAAADTDAIKKRVAICLESDDYKEGRAAFAAKRPPIFTGK